MRHSSEYYKLKDILFEHLDNPYSDAFHCNLKLYSCGQFHSIIKEFCGEVSGSIVTELLLLSTTVTAHFRMDQWLSLYNECHCSEFKSGLLQFWGSKIGVLPTPTSLVDNNPIDTIEISFSIIYESSDIEDYESGLYGYYVGLSEDFSEIHKVLTAYSNFHDAPTTQLDFNKYAEIYVNHFRLIG